MVSRAVERGSLCPCGGPVLCRTAAPRCAGQPWRSVPPPNTFPDPSCWHSAGSDAIYERLLAVIASSWKV